ncbi:chorismate mutase [Candidatus Gottesmanbacteria bacterium]|nr:chorismate mutase [Candidatus Gottesmanbacteria bacterium]
MKLENLRKEIDKIDENLVLLLGRRLDVVKKIAKVKKRDNLPAEDKIREKEVLTKVKQLGDMVGLNSQWLIKIFQLIIKESKRFTSHGLPFRR